MKIKNGRLPKKLEFLEFRKIKFKNKKK